jgi:hypothetical protein
MYVWFWTSKWASLGDWNIYDKYIWLTLLADAWSVQCIALCIIWENFYLWRRVIFDDLYVYIYSWKVFVCEIPMRVCACRKNDVNKTIYFIKVVNFYHYCLFYQHDFFLSWGGIVFVSLYHYNLCLNITVY